MTIAYACDENYVALTAISAVSALRFNPAAKIVLLGCNLSEDGVGVVKSRVEKAGGSFRYCDISSRIQDIASRKCAAYTSYAIYARIFAPQVMENVERILYLDCDTLVCDSLSDLYEMNMDGCPFSLCHDCISQAYKKFINIDESAPYFNTGVMLIDVNRWKEARCTERILAELDDPHGPMVLPEQDIIARIFQGEVKVLAPRWNFLSQFFLFSYDGIRRIVGKYADAPMFYSREEYDSARKRASIYHFSGHTLGRPWYVGSKSPMRGEYVEAASLADLREMAAQVKPLQLAYRLQYVLYRILPQKVFDFVGYCMYRIFIRKTYGV